MQPVALTPGFQDVAAVGESVQGGSRQPFAAEDFGPVLERQVGRHDQAVALVCRGDHVEQHIGAGHVADQLTPTVQWPIVAIQLLMRRVHS